MDLRLVPETDPVLRQKCSPVEHFDEALVQLGEAMIASLPTMGGVGLAAPQIGKAIRLFVVDIWWPESGGVDRAIAFVNPQVAKAGSGRQKTREGCLSLPGRRRKLERAKKVYVEALDLHGKPFSMEAEGFLAVAIQHEYDHLDGILFTDHKAVL